MTFTITVLTVIKLLAICFCLGIGGLFTYLFAIGLAISETQRWLLATFMLMTVIATFSSVYLIATYQG